MKKPFQKNISNIEIESAHDGSGARQVLLSEMDDISSQLEAVTKGFLKPGNKFDWHNHIGIDEFWIVIDGEGKVEYEDGTIFKYKKDDLIYNPEDLRHKITAEGDKISEYYFVRLKG